MHKQFLVEKTMITGKNILITGGLGFIGRNLARCLLSQNNDVTVIDNLSPQIHKDETVKKSLLDLGCRVIVGDILDKNIVTDLMENIQIVYHLAAETGTGQSMYEVEQYSKTNITGSEILLKCIDSFGKKVEKIFLASSRSVYGEGKYTCPEHGITHPTTRDLNLAQSGVFNPCCIECGQELKVLPTDETSPRHPNSIYAATKSYQEDLFSIYESMNEIDTTIFRFQNVYGPGQSLSNPYTGIISIFYSLIKKREKINIFEDGLSTRDFVFIDDVIYFLSNKPTYLSPQQKIINLGSGMQTSVHDIVKYLEIGMNQKANYYVSSQVRRGDIRHNFADTKFLQMMYGKYDFTKTEVGVRKFIEWASLNLESTNINYAKSIAELKERNLLG